MKVSCSSGAMAVTDPNEKKSAFWELREGKIKVGREGGRNEVRLVWKRENCK
jgi:hypothetical protein